MLSHAQLARHLRFHHTTAPCLCAITAVWRTGCWDLLGQVVPCELHHTAPLHFVRCHCGFPPHDHHVCQVLASTHMSELNQLVFAQTSSSRRAQTRRQIPAFRAPFQGRRARLHSPRLRMQPQHWTQPMLPTPLPTQPGQTGRQRSHPSRRPCLPQATRYCCSCPVLRFFLGSFCTAAPLFSLAC